jgi:hypothetical protein
LETFHSLRLLLKLLGLGSIRKEIKHPITVIRFLEGGSDVCWVMTAIIILKAVNNVVSSDCLPDKEER